MEKVFFAKAEEKDIKGMANIENEFFESYSRAFTEDVISEWYEHNSDMFYVVKDIENHVLAFTILTPVTKELYDRLKRGEVSDLFDFPKEDVPQDLNSEYLYVADICVSKQENKLGYLRVFKSLLAGMADIIYENAKYATTSPITDEGVSMAERIGFVKVAEETYGGKKYPICELIVTEEKYAEASRLAGKKNSK